MAFIQPPQGQRPSGTGTKPAYVKAKNAAGESNIRSYDMQYKLFLATVSPLVPSK